MAEFKEVARQAKRMCKSFGEFCDECKIYRLAGEDICVFRDIPGKWLIDKIPDAEHIVMEWAEEHPEPKYPTWKEWWRREFPSADNNISPCTFGIRERFGCFEQGCEVCRAQPIPADIAEKLGIKPIGGEENEKA